MCGYLIMDYFLPRRLLELAFFAFIVSLPSRNQVDGFLPSDDVVIFGVSRVGLINRDGVLEVHRGV